MSPELQTIAVQFYYHVSPSVLRDQYTELPLEGVMVTWYGRISYICTFWYNFDSFMSISRDRNLRYMFYRYRSTPILRFQPIPSFIFLHSPFNFQRNSEKRKLYQSKIIATEDVISTVHPWNEWNVQFATVSFKVVTMKERYPLN